MKQEDYVSFEVAQILKEKGYNWPCLATYRMIYENEFSLDVADKETDLDSCSKNIVTGFIYQYLAPTLYEAQKWLREKCNLYVEISYMYENYYIYDILTIPTHDLIGLKDRKNNKYSTYEEALNEGIKEALKFI